MLNTSKSLKGSQIYENELIFLNIEKRSFVNFDPGGLR